MPSSQKHTVKRGQLETYNHVKMLCACLSRRRNESIPSARMQPDLPREMQREE